MNLNQRLEQWLIREQQDFHSGRDADPPHRPHVTLCYAQSWDGSITTDPGQTVTLSSDAGERLTHQLRSLHDGILVGIGTVLADDPRLTVREWSGDDPRPVVLDSQLRMPADSRLCRNSGDGGQRCWVLTTPEAATQRSDCELIEVPGDDDGHVRLRPALRTLHERGIRHLMVEGGAAVITAFLRSGLADATVLTVAPVLLGGYNAIGRLGETGSAAFPHITPLHTQQMEDELIAWGRLHYGDRN